MASPAAPTASIKKVFRRFGRNRRGSAAVEFALIAPVFFALLFAILETAIMFFASQILETVAQESTRQIMTGQAQAAGYSAAQFQTQVVCKQVPTLLNCANIIIDVENYPSFSNVTIPNPIVGGVLNTNGFGFNPGGSCAVVVARFYYNWPLFVTGLGYNISNLNGNQRLLVATAAFRNEPYAGAC